MFPKLTASSLPWISVDQMREVDRLMIEEIGITLPMMMENAGRNTARLTRYMLGGSVSGRKILVIAGPGGNGGGGLVAARHLVNAGAEVEVCISNSVEQMAPVTRMQYRIICEIGVGFADSDAVQTGGKDLVVDALLGYSQRGDPKGEVARIIKKISGSRTLSLDNPSGLELSIGSLKTPSVQAEATLTLALPKEGLRAQSAIPAVGQLYLADISVPESVYRRIGIDYTSPFGENSMVQIVE